MELWNRTSPEKIDGGWRWKTARRVRHVAGAVPGREQHVDLEAGERQRLPARDGVLGVVGLVRAELRIRHVGHEVGEQVGLGLRAPDLRARRARHGSDRADVIEVAVGEEDRLERDAGLLDGRDEARRLLPRVDHDGARRVGVRTDQEAVLLQRPDREHADVERHYDEPWARRLRRR